MKSITQLKEMKAHGEKITCLTAYDASFSRLLENNGIDVILVGDSLGMVVQGKATTLPVTVEEMEYHTSMVCRGASNTFVIADMPFMSDLSYEDALHHAGQLIKAGATCVKLEGAQAFTLEIIEGLSARGVPVCAHIGLQPQSVNKMGGYKVQGKTEEQAIQFWKRQALICLF
jgi:3-methyl-2-oxobutanoate hydroxymethyltransferase